MPELEHLGRPAFVDRREHRQQQPVGAVRPAVVGEAELAGLHEIGVLGARRAQQHRVPLGEGAHDDRVGGRDHRLHEPLLHGARLACCSELVEGVLAQQLEQPVPRHRAVTFRP